MDDRLSLSVTHADGRITRWGPGEVDAGSVPNDLQFSTSMPGGFRDLSCSLLRRIDLDYPDQALFDNVRAYGPGNRTAWDGRFTQFPRSHGQGFSVTPGAVGWAAHLKDDPSFREIYVDIDLSHWVPMGNTRRTVILGQATASQPVDPTISPDPTSGSPGILMEFDGEWAINKEPTCEAIYDAGPGCRIARIYVDWQRNANSSSTSFIWRVGTADDDVLAGFTTTGDLQAEPATSAQTNWDPATPARVGYLNFAYNINAAAAAPGTRFGLTWRRVAVYGDHGLEYRTAPGVAPEVPWGVYASDVVADVISRAAPLLSTDGIEATDFVIQHLVFTDPVSAEDVILFVNAYHQWEWGVYDNRDFFYRPTDPDRLTWEARLDQGAFVDLEGDTAEQVFNGVFVSYQDSTGARKTMGPPGAAADATSAQLADTSETNPVNAHGIPRRWAKLEISQPTSQAGAEQLGYVWLREHSLPQRRGNLNLVGSVTHPTEGDVPVWRVRAGDFIRPTDMPGYVPRRIISTSYTHATRSLSCELDNTSLKLDAILERLGVGLVGVL